MFQVLHPTIVCFSVFGNRLWKFGVIAVAGVLAGCAAEHMNVFPGPERPKSEIAIVSGDMHGNPKLAFQSEIPEWVLIKSVDGQELGDVHKGWPIKIHVLPGKRMIEAKYQMQMLSPLAYLADEKYRPHFETTLELDAIAGHEYLIKFVTKREDSLPKHAIEVTYWIEDRATGEIVSGSRPGP